MEVESGNMDLETDQLPKKIVYGPTLTSIEANCTSEEKKLSKYSGSTSVLAKNTVGDKFQSTTVKCGRGRPRKIDDVDTGNTFVSATVKRERGRPRKMGASLGATKVRKQKGRGRPRKQNIDNTEDELVSEIKSGPDKLSEQYLKIPQGTSAAVNSNKYEELNTVQDVDTTKPHTRSGRHVKSPDRYKTTFVSECTVKLSKLPEQSHTKSQVVYLEEDDLFQGENKVMGREKRKTSRTWHKSLPSEHLDTDLWIVGYEDSQTFDSNLSAMKNINSSRQSSYKNKIITRSIERNEIILQGDHIADNDIVNEHLNPDNGKSFEHSQQETIASKNKKHMIGKKRSRGGQKDKQSDQAEHGNLKINVDLTVTRSNDDNFNEGQGNNVKSKTRGASIGQIQNSEIIGMDEAEKILSEETEKQKKMSKTVNLENICKESEITGHNKDETKRKGGNLSKKLNTGKKRKRKESFKGCKTSALMGKRDKICIGGVKNKSRSSFDRKRNKSEKEGTKHLTGKKQRLASISSVEQDITAYEGVDLDEYIENEWSEPQEYTTRNVQEGENSSQINRSDSNELRTMNKIHEETKTEKKHEQHRKNSIEPDRDTSATAASIKKVDDSAKQLTDGIQITELEQWQPYRIQGYKATVSDFVVPAVENTRSKCREREKLMKELKTMENEGENRMYTYENYERNKDSHKNVRISQKKKKRILTYERSIKNNDTDVTERKSRKEKYFKSTKETYKRPRSFSTSGRIMVENATEKSSRYHKRSSSHSPSKLNSSVTGESAKNERNMKRSFKEDSGLVKNCKNINKEKAKNSEVVKPGMIRKLKKSMSSTVTNFMKGKTEKSQAILTSEVHIPVCLSDICDKETYVQLHRIDKS